MLRDYKDIISRISEEPIYWDDNGVPRYEPFSPEDLGVYDDIAIYYRIACQNCRKEFHVASSSNTTDRLINGSLANISFEKMKPNIKRMVEHLHYGDPPRHNCVGDTMNVFDMEVLEAWEQYSNNFEWVRHPELEGPIKGSIY